ncbi:MAG: HlyD family efflux transporter periplasmic adaptor subunit [Actinomycetota bacterium]
MRKWIVIGVVVAVLAAGGIVLAASSGGSDEARPVLITDVATVRDLRDEVSVPGTLERAEQRRVNWLGGGATGAGAGGGSVVNAVLMRDGAPLNPGDRILAVDGRVSVAAPGLFPFFRKLDVGAEGADVLQLKTILAAAGFPPGPLDSRFTEQTRFALGQWQAARGYPGAAPSAGQAVTVALQQGAGYELGAQTSAGLTIGPPAARRTAARAAARPAALPVITVRPASTTVNRPGVVSLVVSADAAVTADLDVTLSFGGTVSLGDLVPGFTPRTVTIPSGSQSVTVSTIVLPNATAPDQTLIATVVADPDYTVGSPGVATVTVQSSVIPQIAVSGTTSITRGQSAAVTLTTNVAAPHDLQVNLNVGGTAQPDVDYVAFPPIAVIPAGQSSVTVTVQSKTRTTITPDRFVVVAATPGAQYTLSSQSAATVTILGDAGAVVPVVTISAGNLRVTGGQPAQFTIGLDRPLSQALDLVLQYGGDAVPGSDFNPPGGVVTVPPNQTALTVPVATLNNGLVQNDTTLVVGLVPQSTYAVGTPGSAAVTILAPTKPKLTIVGSAGAVGLGGGVTFTVMADQAPVRDTSVQYAVTGTAQQGRDIQPVTGTVVLPAGATSVDIPILTLNTNVFFLPTDVIVTNGGGRLGQIRVKEGDVVAAGGLLFTITEPTIAVTLAVSAADRTKLKVGQNATVKVQGGGPSAPGVITALADFPTTNSESRQQTFEGTVQVRGDLGAADGTPVTVEVVVAERLAVLTVPIAAVKQNGSGDDVVRLIDLRTGKTREVTVETGLSEGSYIEVRSGLTATDVVVVELQRSR